MPLTLSRRAEVGSRQGATTEPRAVGVEILGLTRPDADGLIPEEAGKRGSAGRPVDIVDEWGMDSFPASDPPTNW